MKKILLLAAIAVALAACGGNTRKKADQKAAETKTETVAKTPEMKTGAYTEQRALTDQEKALFAEVTKGLVGVAYTPETVATQVVAGTNYKFVCKAVTATPPQQTYMAEVVIWQPLPNKGDKARITSIAKIAEKK